MGCCQGHRLCSGRDSLGLEQLHNLSDGYLPTIDHYKVEHWVVLSGGMKTDENQVFNKLPRSYTFVTTFRSFLNIFAVYLSKVDAFTKD